MKKPIMIHGTLAVIEVQEEPRKFAAKLNYLAEARVITLFLFYFI